MYTSNRVFYLLKGFLKKIHGLLGDHKKISMMHESSRRCLPMKKHSYGSTIKRHHIMDHMTSEVLSNARYTKLQESHENVPVPLHVKEMDI